MIKATVATIFQQGAMHLVKLTPVNIATGDILLGFISDEVDVETHPETFHPEIAERPRKVAIAAGQHFTKLSAKVDGKDYVFVQGEEISVDFGGR